MAVDKKIRYEDKGPTMQGGVQNYLGKQPQVMAPRKWKSAPDKPETELAYITKAEKDLILKANIHGGLEKGPNMGPSGIMSLDSFGDADTGKAGGLSGGDVSAAESGSSFAGANTIGKDYGAGLRGGYIASGAGSGTRLNEPQSVLDVVKGLQSKYNFNPNRGSGMVGNVVSGIIGLINPLAGLFTRGFTNLRNKFGPILTAPTLDRGLNPEKYVNRPYVIGTNPMDKDRYNRSEFGNILDYPLYNQYQNEWNQKINRDLINEPENQVFNLRNGIQTIDQPIKDPTVPEDDPFDTDYYFDPEPMNKPEFGFTENNTYAKLNNLEQSVYRNLKTRDELFQDLNEEQKKQLQELEQKKNQQGYLGSSTFVV